MTLTDAVEQLRQAARDLVRHILDGLTAIAHRFAAYVAQYRAGRLPVTSPARAEALKAYQLHTQYAAALMPTHDPRAAIRIVGTS